MTKVQKRFRLQCELDDAMLERIAAANSIYGIERIMLAPAKDELVVEFDATRLRSADVESALGQCGLPVVETTFA